MVKKKLPAIEIPSAKSEDQPATRKMLHLVRDELKYDIRSLEQKMESGFQRIESRFHGVDSKFQNIESRFVDMESRFVGMESRFKNMESGFSRLESRYHRMEILLEEQNSNNRVVLEGLQALWQRQDRIEKRLP